MWMMDAIRENRILSLWAQLLPRPVTQLGGVHEADAELLPLGDGRVLALKVDSIVEELRMGLYRSAFTAGRTAVVSVLSDLAAVGAEPLGVLLAVNLPPGREESLQVELAAGVRDACEGAGVHVLGGDTSEADPLQITCAAAGMLRADTVLTRVGVRPGDLVYASGPLGAGSALAAAVLLGAGAELYREQDYRPCVRLREGIALRGVASACMDTSDGLLATLDQLARINEVAIRVTRPLAELLEPKAAAMQRALALPAFAFIAAIHGEFELVFSVPEARVPALDQAAATLGWRPLLVGQAEPGHGVYVGERPVDAAAVRNLFDQSAGDLDAYVKGLLALSVE